MAWWINCNKDEQKKKGAIKEYLQTKCCNKLSAIIKSNLEIGLYQNCFISANFNYINTHTHTNVSYEMFPQMATLEIISTLVWVRPHKTKCYKSPLQRVNCFGSSTPKTCLVVCQVWVM